MILILQGSCTFKKVWALIVFFGYGLEATMVNLRKFLYLNYACWLATLVKIVVTVPVL